jgi:predicted nucleotidyltransferase
MSRVKTESIWQHENVLPYILTSLKDRINEITAVEKIILFGSRGRLPLERWNELEGKDWDILVQAKCKLKNAHVLVEEDYHLDLLVLNEEQTERFIQKMNTKELFPVNELECLMNKNTEDERF